MDDGTQVARDGGWHLGQPPRDRLAAVQAVAPNAPAAGGESAEVLAARSLAAQAAAALPLTRSFRQLDPSSQSALLRDVNALEQALQPLKPDGGPVASALETPDDLRRRILAGRQGQGGSPPATPATGSAPNQPASGNPPGPATAATSTIAARAGALADEIDFPAFVAGLVHGTFDAIVDANIRQMETFASLVSAVAKDIDQFTRENVTSNQVRDWLVARYPNDLELDPAAHRRGQPKLRRRAKRDGDQDDSEPAWLEDFGLAGTELTDDAIEEQLVPAARNVVGEQRLQMLATMVLMGMSRVVVRDGSVSARLRFRAVARDKASVDYATSTDSGGGSGWGSRGSAAQENHATLVSTVSANVQTDSMLDAQLFGEVRINFASETLPLERFVDAASMAFLERNARPAPKSRSAPAPTPQPAPTPAPGPTPPTGSA